MELVYLLFKELMKRGWKVYWEYDELMSYWQTRWKKDFWFWVLWEIKYSLRELVSKESGLWQFVCENWLIPEDKMKHERVLDLTFWPYWPEVKAQMHSRTYEYWVISSSLCDEDKLEQFLIENIQLWSED